jgi:hypothetical protein
MRRHILDLSETQIIPPRHEHARPLDLAMQPGSVILHHTGPILAAISILRSAYAYNYHSITCRLTLGIDNG